MEDRDLKAIRMLTEYLQKPLGIDIKEPRLYWNCEGGKKQTAYRIVVKRSGVEIWDSKKVESDRMTHIKYEGKPLCSRDTAIWRIKLWDENDKEGEWSESYFEMGLLEKDDWKAKWITGDYKPKKNRRYPVDCFLKNFILKQNIEKARLYITACGIYEVKINGEKAGNFCFAPGCTDYRYRIHYQTYDVTSMLHSKNRMEIQLADGWYRGSIGCFAPTNVFGRQTKLLCQLEIRYKDGSSETIYSDDSFGWSSDGPIRFADLKDGEIYDARMNPSYDKNALITGEKLIPEASNNVDVCERERFKAKLITTPSGEKVLDFGQNIAGLIEFSVKGRKGQKIKLSMGEILDENGEFTQKNFQIKKPAKNFNTIKLMLLLKNDNSTFLGKTVLTPKQEIEFICSGETDYYKTSFAVFGFRYAKIETDVDFNPNLFRSVAAYSDMEQTGEFSCSNEKINRLAKNTLWSMKGNFMDVPTDCPTRERMGWTGDAQVFFNTGSYFMNTASFFRKWLKDVEDSQYRNGKISAVAPYQGAELIYKNTGGTVGWMDAAILIPYRYWKFYGDDYLLREFYPMMKKCTDYIIGRTGHKSRKKAGKNPYNKYTYEKGVHLGEWLEPKDVQPVGVDIKTLHTEECTAYLHYTMSCMSEIANRLDKSKDEAIFLEYAEGAKKAYEWLFFKDGSIDTDRQAKLVRPLALGLTEGENKESVRERLVKAVENYRYRVGTGFLSTSFILPVLTEAGRSDVAYRMLENEEKPGWLAQVETGATTIWEDWEGEASRNHYSPGSVCEWLFNTVAGIRIINENRFEIRPVPGGNIQSVNAEYNSIYGMVKSGWEIIDDKYKFEFAVPSNTFAQIILPNGETYNVESGKRSFSINV